MNALELTIAGSDKVVAHACGKCRFVARTKDEADRCCGPRLCGCGAEVDRRSMRCATCIERAVAERRQADARREAELYAAAVKVPIAEYDGEMVCFGDDRYETTDTAWDMMEGGDLDEAWAWACTPMSWPTLDATDIAYNLAEDVYEDAMDDLDVDDLQRRLDEWLAANPCRGHTRDTKRVVVLEDGRARRAKEG